MIRNLQSSGSFLTAAGRAGQWRTHSDAMQIVSGPVHNPTIHFEAPPSARVPAEMQQFRCGCVSDIGAARKMLGQDAPSFENGINAAKYQNLTRCSKATATRDLQDLVAQGVLAPVHSKGRYARYKLAL